MHKTAIDFALKHKIGLGRYSTGWYFIADGQRHPEYVSMYPTAGSAIKMMRRYLKRKSA